MRPATVLGFLAAAFLTLGLIGAAGLLALVLTGGLVTVDVTTESDSGRTRILLPVPAVLVDAGLTLAGATAPHLGAGPGGGLVPAEWRDEAASWEPCIKELARRLEELPAGTYVDVRGLDESVLVAKRGRRFVVEVDTSDTRVRVRVPARLVRRALELATG